MWLVLLQWIIQVQSSKRADTEIMHHTYTRSHQMTSHVNTRFITTMRWLGQQYFLQNLKKAHLATLTAGTYRHLWLSIKAKGITKLPPYKGRKETAYICDVPSVCSKTNTICMCQKCTLSCTTYWLQSYEDGTEISVLSSPPDDLEKCEGLKITDLNHYLKKCERKRQKC
jgi:hypothetical protein